VAVFLVESAVHRFFKPEPVATGLMIPVALVCLAGNVASAFFLAFGADRTLNVKAALAHIVSDSFSSVAVIVAALVIRWTGWTRIDPVLAVLIAVYASIQAVVLLKDTVHILMQGAPAGLDQEAIRRDLVRVRGVSEVHHLHLWSLDEHEAFFEAHVAVATKDLRNLEPIKKAIKSLLERRYGIRHSTLEFESSRAHGCDECLHDHPGHAPGKGRPPEQANSRLRRRS
jgi:cobalt-zinc-cadmium efflux system protein